MCSPLRSPVDMEELACVWEVNVGLEKGKFRIPKCGQQDWSSNKRRVEMQVKRLHLPNAVFCFLFSIEP